jgi:hypothetical protein
MFLDFLTTIFKNYMFKVGLNKFQYSSQCEDENVDIILGLFLCLWGCKNIKVLSFLCVILGILGECDEEMLWRRKKYGIINTTC